MRCFLTVDPPNSLAAGIATVQDQLSGADGLRFTDPESTHVTLKFFGKVSPDRVGAVEDAVESAVKAASVGPSDASVGGLGVFPLLDYIRVVWIGVDGGMAELTRLHKAIERETTALGFNLEDREFALHITLAHMGDVHGKVLVRHVVGGGLPTAGSFRMHEVCLKKSNLGPDDPEYETVTRVSL